VQLANWYRLQSEIQWRAGHLAEGLDSVHKALHHAELAEDVFFTPCIHNVAASIHQQLGDRDQSELHAAKASELTEKWNLAPAFVQLK
jgi:hypothetical protein